MQVRFAKEIWLCALIGATVAVGAGVALAQSNPAQNAVLALDHGWQFRQIAPAQSADSDWLSAKVPGDVHLDLLANNKIPDPFNRDNEAKLQWIENESWEYRLNFNITTAFLAHSNIDLVFDGLDAASTVYLNGIQVLAAAGLTQGKRITCYEHVRFEAEQAGGTFVDQEAVRDGRMVTGQTWQSHPDFYRELFACLAS